MLIKFNKWLKNLFFNSKNKEITCPSCGNIISFTVFPGNEFDYGVVNKANVVEQGSIFRCPKCGKNLSELLRFYSKNSWFF